MPARLPPPWRRRHRPAWDLTRHLRRRSDRARAGVERRPRPPASRPPPSRPWTRPKPRNRDARAAPGPRPRTRRRPPGGRRHAVRPAPRRTRRLRSRGPHRVVEPGGRRRLPSPATSRTPAATRRLPRQPAPRTRKRRRGSGGASGRGAVPERVSPAALLRARGCSARELAAGALYTGAHTPMDRRSVAWPRARASPLRFIGITRA
jgi:hypothetical protein